MIVIPMAGLSKRFTDAGYTVPKYQLRVAGQSLFSMAVRSFESVFDRELFVFAFRDIANTRAFIEDECAALGIRRYILREIAEKTDGQAHTVALALEGLETDDEQLIIFNIDTIRKGWEYPHFPGNRTPDGYLEVVRADGEAWSFAEPGPNQTVNRTTEKERISDLCSTGLYGFSSVSLYLETFAEARNRSLSTNGEYYVAPLYNLMIGRGLDVSYYEIHPTEVEFSGVPSEYERLVRRLG